ncbi:MAG: hypothetical protein AAF556_12515, partial [Pseudomonadota bacterium]
MPDRKPIPPPLVDDLPAFDPSLWAEADIDATTNCYAFAADDPEGHPDNYGPQPGDRNFHYLRSMSVKEVTKKAEVDGFISIGNDPRQKPGHYLVFLAVSPGNDYHWYRQMADGTWWHKPAPGKPLTNRDFDGNVITDPRTANRRNKQYHYEKSGGFFQVPIGGLRVGITPDRRWLKELEHQEVIMLVQRQKDMRKAEAQGKSDEHVRRIREKRRQIKGEEPRHMIGRWLRKFRHGVEDVADRLLGRPPRIRLSAEGKLDIEREKLASDSRQAENSLRRLEVAELRD